MTFDLNDETHVRAFALQLAAGHGGSALDLATGWADFIINGETNGRIMGYQSAIRSIVSGDHILSVENAKCALDAALKLYGEPFLETLRREADSVA